MPTDEKTSDRRPIRRTALVVTYVAAAGLGYVLGVRGYLPYGALKSSTSTPLARVGLALRDGTAHADAPSLTLLRTDVDTVRRSLRPPETDALDLVAALRGLRTNGATDVAGAEKSCLALELARCDARALQVLQKRSEP